MATLQISAKALNNLLFELYRCVQQPQLWQPFLRQVALAVDADSISMRWVGRSDMTLRHSYSYGLYPDTCTELVRLDPFLPHLFNKEIGVGLGSQTFISDEEYERTDHYEAFFQPQDRFYVMGVLLSNGPDYNNFVGVHRSRSHGYFGTQEQKLLTWLAPHIQQAFELQNRVHAVKQSIQHYQQALGGLTAGVWLLDQNLQIDWMNHAAHQALKIGQCGMRQGLDQRLAFDPPNDGMNSALSAYLVENKAHAWLQFPNSNAALLVNAVDDDLMADLPPVLQHRQFIAILLDPNQTVVVDHNTLARLYHLTAAESRLVQTLVQGMDIQQSADRLCISPHTARSHLKAIFIKTDTHRQSDLIKKVTLSSIYR